MALLLPLVLAQAAARGEQTPYDDGDDGGDDDDRHP